jgi:hypothetical protein
MQLQMVLCYDYIYEITLVAQFLKWNKLYIVPRSAFPSHEWKIWMLFFSFRATII